MLGLRLDGRGEQGAVPAWAGNCVISDIVVRDLPGPVERNEDMDFMCYDNEAYMNTGIQYASATPIHTVSTTSPTSAPNLRKVKDIVSTMSAHGVPCTATASIAYARDLMAKLKKDKFIRGTTFLNLFAFCRTGWRIEPACL